MPPVGHKVGRPLILPRGGVRAPSAGTLAKYGLTAAEWWGMCERQGFVCPVCRGPFADRPLVVDHEHVKGWRARKPKLKSGKRRANGDARVMTPAERKKHVRGVLHSYCNRFVRRWLTIDRAESILAYLRAHRDRLGGPE